MKYSDNGFWVDLVDEGYRIGLSPKGQDYLGDVGFVEFLCKEELSTTEAMIGVEASKAVSELEAPINGVVVRYNRLLESMPEKLNSIDPEDNWLYVVTDVSIADYEALNDEENFSTEA